MTNEKIIEVEVTVEDIEKLRADGVSESDLPEIGIKRFRPARHINQSNSSPSDRKREIVLKTISI